MPTIQWNKGIGLPENEIKLIDSWLNAGAEY